MFWLLLTLLVVVGFFLVISRRRRYESVEEEPWRASLGDDEPLDLDAAREAEEEWLAEEGWNQEDEEGDSWRG